MYTTHELQVLEKKVRPEENIVQAIKSVVLCRMRELNEKDHVIKSEL